MKEIIMYETSDGIRFREMKEAEFHEKAIEIGKILEEEINTTMFPVNREDELWNELVISRSFFAKNYIKLIDICTRIKNVLKPKREILKQKEPIYSIVAYCDICNDFVKMDVFKENDCETNDPYTEIVCSNCFNIALTIKDR